MSKLLSANLTTPVVNHYCVTRKLHQAYIAAATPGTERRAEFVFDCFTRRRQCTILLRRHRTSLHDEFRRYTRLYHIENEILTLLVGKLLSRMLPAHIEPGLTF